MNRHECGISIVVHRGRVRIVAILLLFLLLWLLSSIDSFAVAAALLMSCCVYVLCVYSFVRFTSMHVFSHNLLFTFNGQTQASASARSRHIRILAYAHICCHMHVFVSSSHLKWAFFTYFSKFISLDYFEIVNRLVDEVVEEAKRRKKKKELTPMSNICNICILKWIKQS